jgi:hypothetical protein
VLGKSLIGEFNVIQHMAAAASRSTASARVFTKASVSRWDHALSCATHSRRIWQKLNSNLKEKNRRRDNIDRHYQLFARASVEGR